MQSRHIFINSSPVSNGPSAVIYVVVTSFILSVVVKCRYDFVPIAALIYSMYTAVHKKVWHSVLQ